MDFEIIQCPHCHARVVPMAEGVCPGCRKDTRELPGAVEHGAVEREQQAPGLPRVDLGAAEPPAAQRMEEFQRALLTMTPRVVATPAIVAANVLVFVAMVATGVHFFAPTAHDALAWGANFGPKTEHGQWWRLATCMFLHFGILHLAFNMWVLWSLGTLVERLVGNVGFVVLYVVSGIAGSLASLSWNPLVVSAGASGAVFGVAGALLGLIALRRDTIPAPVLQHLWQSMAAFLFYNLIFGLMSSRIDMAAHLGGLVAGFGCGLMLSQPLRVETGDRLKPGLQRVFRNTAVATVGTVGLVLWAGVLPKPPPAGQLPGCTSPEVTKLLEQMVRDMPLGATLKSIDGHRELSYDQAAQVRRGECVANTEAGATPLAFTIEWQDRDKGQFQVRILPYLPLCTSPEVARVLEEIIRTSLGEAKLLSIDGFHELSYDHTAGVRHGKCVAHTDAGDFPLEFLVEWQDREKGRFQVRTMAARE